MLRGDYKQSEYGKVILSFTVLRRLDCVLEATKPAVLLELSARQQAGLNPEPFLLRKAGQSFYNTSALDMKKLMGNQDLIRLFIEDDDVLSRPRVVRTIYDPTAGTGGMLSIASQIPVVATCNSSTLPACGRRCARASAASVAKYLTRISLKTRACLASL